MWTAETLRVFLDDLWTRFRKHISNASAHHVPYTDVMVNALIAVHTAISNAHHTKTIDASELTTGELDDARIPAAIARDAEVTADIATHTAISGAHHTPYTNANAVAACDAANKFLERDEENVITSEVEMKRTSTGKFFNMLVETAGQFIFGDLMLAEIKSTTNTYNSLYSGVVFPSIYMEGTDTGYTIGALSWGKQLNANWASCTILLLNSAGALQNAAVFSMTDIYLKNQIIGDPKNHAYSALSGTRKLVEIKIGGAPHYIEAWPTKA